MTSDSARLHLMRLSERQYRAAVGDAFVNIYFSVNSDEKSIALSAVNSVIYQARRQGLDALGVVFISEDLPQEVITGLEEAGMDVVWEKGILRYNGLFLRREGDVWNASVKFNNGHHGSKLIDGTVETNIRALLDGETQAECATRAARVLIDTLESMGVKLGFEMLALVPSMWTDDIADDGSWFQVGTPEVENILSEVSKALGWRESAKRRHNMVMDHHDAMRPR